MDAEVISPIDTLLALRIFRAKNPAFVPAMIWTVNFAGSQQWISVNAVWFRGLEDLAPIVVKPQTGPATTDFFVPKFPSLTGPRLIFASVSSGGMSALIQAPVGFSECGFLATNGAREDGSSVYLVDDGKKLFYAATWDVTISYAWAACALVYKGVPKEKMLGQKFCGEAEVIAQGATPGMPGKCQDVYGFSACCYDFKSHLRCCDFIRELPLHPTFDLIILAVDHPNAGTFAHPGKRFHMQQVDDFLDFFWDPGFLEIAGVPVDQLGIECIEDVGWRLFHIPGAPFQPVFPEHRPWKLVIGNVNPTLGQAVQPPQRERWLIEIRRTS